MMMLLMLLNAVSLSAIPVDKHLAAEVCHPPLPIRTQPPAHTHTHPPTPDQDAAPWPRTAHDAGRCPQAALARSFASQLAFNRTADQLAEEILHSTSFLALEDGTHVETAPRATHTPTPRA